MRPEVAAGQGDNRFIIPNVEIPRRFGSRILCRIISSMSGPPAISTVLSFEDARHVVERQAALIQANNAQARNARARTESVDLLSAAGRVLSEPVTADRDLPPFPRSTRDGYAVRSADLSKLPAVLEVIGEIKAGEKLERIPASIGPGQSASIMTGAPVPAGADAIVMVEYTSQREKRVEITAVEITKSVAPGENIVPRGAEALKGSVLVESGVRLNEAAIALAASVGKSRLQVYKRPRVAVLTTGDEIVDVDATPGPTQIRNSNSYSLAVQIRRAGGEPVLLPVAPDELQALRRLIEEGLQSDLLILTGGVSMGRYDLVEQALSEMRAEFFFTGAKIQPGRPVVFGKCGADTPFGKLRAGSVREKLATYFFGLPGNPVSTMVTFELFARPVLEALAGESPRKLNFLHARLKREIRVKTGLKRFLPAIFSGEFELSEVELVTWQGSGDIAATARANCYIVIPSDREHIPAGEWVAVMKIDC
jgi:molybdopterin molybdotransferase